MIDYTSQICLIDSVTSLKLLFIQDKLVVDN